VELGAREQRALVGENALSCDVIAVHEITHNTEVFLGRLRSSACWEERQALLAIDVETLDLKLLQVLQARHIMHMAMNAMNNMNNHKQHYASSQKAKQANELSMVKKQMSVCLIECIN
jgi:hypothetical protein